MIREKCRLVTLNNKMVLTGSATTTPKGSTASGTGSAADPYHIDMWDRITIPVTMTTYAGSYSNPHSYNRCEVRTSLHFNDAMRT